MNENNKACEPNNLISSQLGHLFDIGIITKGKAKHLIVLKADLKNQAM